MRSDSRARRATAPLGALRTRAALVATVVSLAACSDDDETLLGEPPPTEIAVDPLEFLGGLPCSKDQGAAKSFVAVVTDETEGFTLAASAPVPCSSRVAFRYVVLGHAYTAEVDVYDRPGSELFPVGGPTSGSRVIVDAQGAVVAPRWRTSCGNGPSGPAVAVDDTSVVVAGCEPLEEQGTATTALVVDPSDALGDLACEDDGGAIDAVRVSAVSGPEGEPLLPTVTLGCGAEPVTFGEGIVTGGVYTFRLEAFASGAETPGWGASCVVVAAEGVARRASCDSLTDTGAIRAAVTDLTEPGFVCGVDIDAFDVALEGPKSLSAPRTACDRAVLLTSAPPGRYEGTLRTFEDGTVESTATCVADVVPGATTELTCSFD